MFKCDWCGKESDDKYRLVMYSDKELAEADYVEEFTIDDEWWICKDCAHMIRAWFTAEEDDNEQSCIDGQAD